ncbi:MAG: hypothetical protein IVW36_12445 [Dehalococcoidia bacterium]|nr:hypothetical protein [Dehalococcoidia bacterium]
MTPTPTDTSTPTPTDTPTLTPTPTDTSTPTATPTPLCAGSGSVLCVLPPSQSAFLGQQVTVSIGISGATNLGAYQATVQFDPSILSVTGVNTFSGSTTGAFLGGTGRTPLCAQQSLAAGQISVACATLGQQPPPGVTGQGILFVVTFTTLAPGTSPVALTNVQLTDPNAATLPSSSVDGSLTVVNATPTPCAGACPTATATSTPTPFVIITGSASSTLNPGALSGPIGGVVSSDVTIANTPPLGAFQFVISFATGSVGVESVVPGPFLGSTGRTVFCGSPIIRTDSVTFGCASQGLAIPAPAGAGILATVRFVVTTPGSTALRLSIRTTDPTGEALDVTAQDGSITGLAGPTATATPCPGACPTASPTPTLTATPTAVSFPVGCQSTATVVCVAPVSRDVAVGADIDVAIAAANVSNLGAFQVTLTVDPAVVTPLGAQLGAFLGSTGRTVLCISPVVGADSVQLSCTTLRGVPPPGASGTGILATVQLRVASAGTSSLALSNVVITDPAGTPIPATTEDGTLNSVAVTPTPCPGGICPTPTDTATPTATPTPAPISCPNTPGTATMCLLPSTQTVAVGATFTVQVIVTNASDIGSYQFRLAFDAVRLTFVSVEDAGFLGSSGRTVQCPPPVTDTGTVFFGCVTVGSSPPGPTAPGVLATVTFTANLAGSVPLQFTKSTLSDPLANPIAVTAIDGSVTVQ